MSSLNKLYIRVYDENAQLLVYADGVNIMGRSVRAIRKNIEALAAASKEIM
jgi:hypothetical protein